jgi:hypothetical protein
MLTDASISPAGYHSTNTKKCVLKHPRVYVAACIMTHVLPLASTLQ